MRQHAPTVEWQVAESDADWERLCALPLAQHSPAVAPAVPGRLAAKRYLGRVVVLLLVLASASAWGGRTTPSGVQTVAADTAATLRQKLATVAPGPDPFAVRPIGDSPDTAGWRQQGEEVRGLLTAFPTAAPAAQLDSALHIVDVQGDQAVARVVIYTEHGVPAYRQTRFYRRIGERWLPTAPDAALWGPERSLETPYFLYHFRQQDAPVVIAVAPQLDALYTSLWSNVGLSISPAPEKLIIDVRVTQPPGRAAPSLHGSNRFMAPSPAVYWAPVELTDRELLAQSLFLPLLEHVLAQARQRYGIEAAWRPVLNGLQLWHVWQVDLPLAAWREDMVKWVYLDLPTSRPGQAVVLPKRYAELCAAHTLWLRSPVQIHLPLFCSDLDRTQGYFSWKAATDPLTRLGQLAVPLRPDQYADESSGELSDVDQYERRVQTIALATLIDYAVGTYGRERLPVLVAGLGQYDSWETLLPAVFGVSAAEFEAGWQAYLTAHYGVPARH